MTTETSITVAASYPENSRALITKAGVERGRQYSFTGVQTAKELRDALKAKGIKGRDLTKQVNDVLRGSVTLSTQLALAFIVQEAKRGIVYTTGDSLKNSSVLRGTRLDEASKAKPAPSLDETIESMTEEQAMALVAKLSAKFGS